MSWALLAAAWAGWSLAIAAALILRRRMALVADAEHELRGAATAIGLLAPESPLLRAQIQRMEAALVDLAVARGAPPPAPAELEAGRLAQVLTNVSANAAEYGSGPVRVVVSNHSRDPIAPRRGRGRGLRIAKRAARELGGRVALERVDGETRAVIELPPPKRDRAA